MKKLTLLSSAALIAAAFTLSNPDIAHAKKKDPAEDYAGCAKSMTVAVDRFKTENISVGWWNDDVALNSKEVLVEELVNSGCFRVLEREDYSRAPAGVMNEKALARSGEARPGGKAAKKRAMKTADALISCALTGASKDNEGFKVGGIGGGGGGFGGLGGGFKKSEVTIACKVISTETSEILAASRVKAGGTSFSVDAGGGGIGKGFGMGDIGYFKESKIGKMMSDAIHKSVVQLTKTVSR